MPFQQLPGPIDECSDEEYDAIVSMYRDVAPGRRKCPDCGVSRASSPERFDALCTRCGDRMHDREMTMERDEHLASRYHQASKLLSAEWEWGHSHDCTDCTETFYCERGDCRPGPRTCQTCADSQAAETVPSPEGYRDSLEPSDVALLDL